MTVDSGDDLAALQRVGKVVAETIQAVKQVARPGITTAMLDDVAADVFAAHGARSAPNLFYDFPGTICIGVNDEAVHGIPGPTPIRAGDLLKIDVTAELDGYIADAAVSVGMPKASRMKHALAVCAREALHDALAAASTGATLQHLGETVERAVRRRGFHVLREVGGHGVGRAIHEAPSVPNWRDPHARGRLHEGLVIAVEPIISASADRLYEDDDGWTLRTMKGSASAHFEHTIVITDDAPIVLTAA